MRRDRDWLIRLLWADDRETELVMNEKDIQGPERMPGELVYSRRLATLADAGLADGGYLNQEIRFRLFSLSTSAVAEYREVLPDRFTAKGKDENPSTA